MDKEMWIYPVIIKLKLCNGAEIYFSFDSKRKANVHEAI